MRYSSFWRQDIFRLATLHKVEEWTFSKGGLFVINSLHEGLLPWLLFVYQYSWQHWQVESVNFPGICILMQTWSLRIVLTSTKVERWGVYFKIWMLFKKHSLPKEGRVKDTLAPFSHALMISILWIWEQFSGLRFSNPIIWLEILTLTYFTFLVCHLQKIWHSENPHYWHK